MGIFDGYGYEPPQQDNNNVNKGLEITENLVINGTPYQNPLVPNSVTGANKNGIAVPMYPDFETSSSSLEQDRAIRSQGNSDAWRFAETFDMRNANIALNTVSGQARASAIYVPYQQKAAAIEVQMGDYNVGGTYSFIGWNLYGPLTVDPSTGTTPLTALPIVDGKVFLSPSATVRDQQIGSTGDTGGGLFVHPVFGSNDIMPGVYYFVQLLVSSVAPTTAPTFIGHNPTALGTIYNRLTASNVPHALFQNGLTSIPSGPIDLSGWTQTTGKQWAALDTNATLI